jgi:parvulin-like peptidyl-prolyl isomerase
VLKIALKDPAQFAVLAGRNSDSPSKSRGGVIAPLQPGKLVKGFEPFLEAVKKTKPGEIHPEIVETIYGFHLIKRLPLRKAFVQHIVIAYTGSEGRPRTSRDKDQASALAHKLRKQIQAGEDFAALAKEYSDDPESAARGGIHPPFSPGEMLPRLEQYAFALRPAQLSDVFDSTHGFHIVKRLR